MLPERFKERMKISLGEKEYEAFIDSFDTEERFHGLRVNVLKADNRAICDKLGLENGVAWEDNGFYYDESIAPGKHPYHEAGLYYIQEPSAMAPVHFLDPKPGDRILDLCAAPGGKTTQIAAVMKGQGILVTNEINRDRAKILSLNVERMGISNALVINEDSAHLADVFEGYFNKILVDAPCSGEGMFRKNDNAADEWSLENVENCAIRQSEILDNAARMLLPGGRLVYSTCTFAPKENEELIIRFLFSHPDFRAEEISLTGGMENARPDFISDSLCDELKAKSPSEFENCISQIVRAARLWPHKVKGEGHFLCSLRRIGADDIPDPSNDNFVPGGRNIPAKKEVVKLVGEFIKDTVSGSCFDINDGLVISFGDQVYYMPKSMPSIMGLKVMRPGLHLGTIKKDRFEPSHAFALFLKPDMVVRSYDIPSDSGDIRSFLNGQTLRIQDKTIKGWTLITTDGYSIGWAKASGGMLKNHYPKGLRINY